MNYSLITVANKRVYFYIVLQPQQWSLPLSVYWNIKLNKTKANSHWQFWFTILCLNFRFGGE